MSSTASGRARRREEVDRAHRLQVRAGALGAAQYAAVGLGVTTLAHYTWPGFRRQTLAFKGFITSMFMIYGLVSAADSALLSHEHEQRITETDLRREARIDLARRGLVATESQISQWKEERERNASARPNST